jgi:hypothetical protein
MQKSIKELCVFENLKFYWQNSSLLYLEDFLPLKSILEFLCTPYNRCNHTSPPYQKPDYILYNSSYKFRFLKKCLRLILYFLPSEFYNDMFLFNRMWLCTLCTVEINGVTINDKYNGILKIRKKIVKDERTNH